MNELLKIKDFGILIENSISYKTKQLVLQPLKEVIGIVYYLDGEVAITIKKQKYFSSV